MSTPSSKSHSSTVELELHADHVATLGGTLIAIRDRLNHGERLHLRVTVDPDAPLTLTLGLRWDFARHVDLKLQWDRTVLLGGTDGFFINQQPGFDTTGTVNLLSLAVDFVW